VIRDKRLQRRKRQLWLVLAVSLSLLAVILHRQITQRVFSGLVAGAHYRVETAEPLIALTFDAVWEPGETGRILDILDRYEVRATFFAAGGWLRYNGHLAREILLRGHEIGHHGYTHQPLTEMDDDKLAAEFERMEEALREELNQTANLLRPPYGETDPRVVSFAAERGYRTILWSVDPHDWLDPGREQIIRRVTGAAHKGAIVLFHTNAPQTPEALPAIIEHLRMQGYEIVTVSAMLERAGQ
jgi:peptidoglycan-N-acetylglucosamine deacetylase